MGTLTLLCYTGVSLFMSLLLPQMGLTKPKSAYEPKLYSLTSSDLWVASHGIFGFCMLSTTWVTSVSGTLVLFSLVGISWAVAAWIPYSLIDSELHGLQAYLSAASHVHSGNRGNVRGLVYGVHNFAICLPQILMSSAMGIVWATSATNDTSSHYDDSSVVWFLRIGGLSALAAMYIATWIQDRTEYEVEYTELIPQEER